MNIFGDLYNVTSGRSASFQVKRLNRRKNPEAGSELTILTRAFPCQFFNCFDFMIDWDKIIAPLRSEPKRGNGVGSFDGSTSYLVPKKVERT